MCLGIPGKLLEVYEHGDLPMGKVEFGGIAKDICLAYTPEAQVGDYVIVHVGFAISRIDEEEAEEIFGYLEQITAEEPSECIAGQVLQGHKRPHECPAFGVRCTPDHPLGAPVVSSEGACAAYYRYRRHAPGTVD